MIVGVHIIILYTSEGKIVAEGFGLRSRQREDLQSGMERKTPDYAKNSNSTTLKSAVGGYGISFPLCAADFQFLPLPSQRAATIRFFNR